MKKIFIFTLIIFFSTFLFADPFNKKLETEERKQIEAGEVLIKNINYQKNMCLSKGYSVLGDKLIELMDDLNPKYLAEIIQIRPYNGNENFNDMLSEFLYNVQDYAGIPYYSVRNDRWYDLYEWAKITDTKISGNTTTLKAKMKMDPFDIIDETITINKTADGVLYIAQNENKLRFKDKFDCISPQKMKVCILLFRDGDNWIFYGIGGVNAPRVPFFTERIQTSFINRINTFCSYIFKKFE